MCMMENQAHRLPLSPSSGELEPVTAWRLAIIRNGWALNNGLASLQISRGI